MPTINNYTFSEPVFTVPEQSNIVSQVGTTAVITITPDPGFLAFAADFSATSFDTTYITNVAFSQSGNNVLCTITLDSSVAMPSNNLTLGLCVSGSPQEILLTIDGKYSATVGSNVTGGTSETDVPYSKSNARSEFSHILTRTYNAASGYFWGGSNIPSINVVTGNQKYYLINQTPTFDSSNRLTNITYDIGYLFPDKSVSGDVISINVPSTQEIYVPSLEITGYLFNTSVIGNEAETRKLTVLGNPTTTFSATLNDGSTTTTIINNQALDANGRFNHDILFPILTTPELYTKSGAPSLIQSNFTQIDTGWSFSNGVASIDGTQTGTSRIKGGYGGATLVTGKTYVVKLVASITSCRIEFAGGGGFVLTTTQENINGIVRFYITATAPHTLISILCGTGDVGSISSLSIKEQIQPKNYTIELTGANVSTVALPNPFTVTQLNEVAIGISELNGSLTPLTGWTDQETIIPALSSTPFPQGYDNTLEGGAINGGIWTIYVNYNLTAINGSNITLIRQIDPDTDFVDINNNRMIMQSTPLETQANGDQTSTTSLIVDDTTGIIAGDSVALNTPLAPYDTTVSSVDSSTQITVASAISVLNDQNIQFYRDGGNKITIFDSLCTQVDSQTINIKFTAGVDRSGIANKVFYLKLDNIIS